MQSNRYKPHYENRQVGEANEVPFEVPEGWEWTTIGKLCSFLSRGKSPKYSEERKYPVFAQKCNLYDGDISLEKARFLDPETIIKWSDEYKLIDGDILVNSTGTGTVGRTRLFHSGVLGDYPFVVPDSHVSVVRTFEEIESKFVLAFLSSDYGQTYIEDNLAGSTNQKELYIGILDNMLFPLPPQEEQLRIVTAIDKWFSLINVLESAKGDLQISIAQAKSKILDLAIHGKLVPQDPNDEPAIELLKRINPKFTPCDNAHDTNQLPDSWCWTTLGDVCKLVTGSTPSKLHPEYYGGDFPFYKPTDLDAGRHVNIPSEFLTDEGKNVSRIIPVGSTAICCIGSIGKCGYIEKEGTTNQQINTAVPSKSLSPLYLYYFCNSSYFIDELSADSSAITISIVNKSKLSKMLISLPPYNEQLRIVAKIEELFAVLDEIQKSIEA